MAKKGVPERRTIGIHCSACRTLLYRYSKGGTIALLGVARHDGLVTAQVGRRALECIEPQVGLTRPGIGAVTMEAVLRQDGPDVPVELRKSTPRWVSWVLWR